MWMIEMEICKQISVIRNLSYCLQSTFFYDNLHKKQLKMF